MIIVRGNHLQQLVMSGKRPWDAHELQEAANRAKNNAKNTRLKLSCASSQALNAALKLTVSGRTPLEVSILSDHSAICSHLQPLSLSTSSNTDTPGQTHGCGSRMSMDRSWSFRSEPYLSIGLDYLRVGLDRGYGLPVGFNPWSGPQILHRSYIRTRHLFWSHGGDG